MENFETHIKCSVKGWLEVAYQFSPLENPWSQIYWQKCKVFGIRPPDYILNGSNRTMIHYSTARQMERLFNALPYRIQKITGVKTDTFKKKLDEWLRDIPDTPKIDDYGASVGAETNSIIDQKNKRKKNKENNVKATLNVR